MRVILSESQIKLIEEQYRANILCESLNESVNFDQMRQKVRKFIMAGVTLSTILIAIDKSNTTTSEKEILRSEAIEQADSVMVNKIIVDPLMDEKVEAIKQCMTYYLNLQKRELEEVKLSPEQMVQVCFEKKFDLPLMLAQAKAESLFGLGDRCAGKNGKTGTNSVWSVGSYDSGKNGAMYDDVNQSIEPYTNLVQRDYIRDRDIDDMLKDGQFTNHLGQRYATDPNYEKTVRSLRNAIMKRYPILTQTAENQSLS